MDGTEMIVSRVETPAMPWGVLILASGRQAGTRIPISGPLILIGRAPGCEIRLNVEGIQPVHAVLAWIHGGPIVRSVTGALDVQVNAQAAAVHTIRSEDHLRVGPFDFRVELPPPPTADQLDVAISEPASDNAVPPSGGEAEAHRLLHAAQALALERQNLEAAKRTLESDRMTLRIERQSYEQRVGQVIKELSVARQELAASQRAAQAEQARARELLERVKRRWQRQRAALAAAWQQRIAQGPALRPEFAGAEFVARLAKLEHLAAELADQRLWLTEECTRLALLQEDLERRQAELDAQVPRPHGDSVLPLRREDSASSSPDSSATSVAAPAAVPDAA